MYNRKFVFFRLHEAYGEAMKFKVEIQVRAIVSNKQYSNDTNEFLNDCVCKLELINVSTSVMCSWYE